MDAPTQYNDSLWATHTAALGGFAAVRWYEFDIEGAGNGTIKQNNWIFVSGTSHDFNASIAAQPGGRAYVQWSFTDPALACATGCPSMAFAGRLLADPANTLTAPTILHNSGVKLMGNLQSGRQRWGDYSRSEEIHNEGAKISKRPRLLDCISAVAFFVELIHQLPDLLRSSNVADQQGIRRVHDHDVLDAQEHHQPVPGVD